MLQRKTLDIEDLKATNAKQVAQFERFAAEGQIDKFHFSHYDWYFATKSESITRTRNRPSNV